MCQTQATSFRILYLEFGGILVTEWIEYAWNIRSLSFHLSISVFHLNKTISRIFKYKEWNEIVFSLTPKNQRNCRKYNNKSNSYLHTINSFSISCSLCRLHLCNSFVCFFFFVIYIDFHFKTMPFMFAHSNNQMIKYTVNMTSPNDNHN